MNTVELDRLWQHVPRKIVSAEITTRPSPSAGALDQVKCVIVTLDDGRHIELFSFYAHERSFAPEHFVGLTGDEARRLKFAPEHRVDWVDS
jgi:hypothetical protein